MILIRRHFLRVSAFALGWLGCFRPGMAEQEKTPAAPPPEPPAVEEYMGRPVAQTMHWTGSDWLIRHQREQEEASSIMREKLALKPGMVVCDMGAGNGFHAFAMAKAVAPGGKVYGVEI